jgi:hypothetical protein
MAIDGWLLYRIQSKRNTTENNTWELAFQASAVGNKGRIMRHTHKKNVVPHVFKKDSAWSKRMKPKNESIKGKKRTQPKKGENIYIHTHTYLLDEAKQGKEIKASST